MGASGAFRLNLDEALCARDGCAHARKHHATYVGSNVRHECSCCGCREFVAGGLGYETLPDTEPAPASE